MQHRGSMSHLEIIERIIKRIKEPTLPSADSWLLNQCKVEIEEMAILSAGWEDRYLAEKRKNRDLEIERDYALNELGAVKYELKLMSAKCKELKGNL